MADHERDHGDDLRGAASLAVEATKAITDLVQAVQVEVASGPRVLGQPLRGPVALFNALTFAPIRAVTSAVGAAIDLALASLAPLLGRSVPGPERDALLAAINGVLGDHLDASGNPLAIKMHLRHAGKPLTLEREALRAALPATRKALLLVHGSSMNEQQWLRLGHDHGAALAASLGAAAIYVRYNSGLHISTNGRKLDALLEALVAQWPGPLDELTIVAHSMGGLVARSACHVASLEKHAWPARLRALVCLGSPHHGAPLERAGNWVETALGVHPTSAPFQMLPKLRSAGITDLRHGNVRDEDWVGRDRFAFGQDVRVHLPLPEGVRCYAVAGTTAKVLPADPLAAPSDGMVPVASALGRHALPERTLAFPEANRFVAAGTNHLDLLSSKAVYEVVERWLSA